MIARDSAMLRRFIYGLLPLVLVAPWLGCKSSGSTELGGAASIAAAPPAIPSTPNPTTVTGQTPSAGTQPPATSAAQSTPGTNAPSNPDQRAADLKEIMSELKSLGSLDPQGQAQLIQDLQKTDPSMWPLVVQAFRTSLAYRQRVKSNAAPAASSIAATSPTVDKPAAGAIAANSTATTPAAKAPAAAPLAATTTPAQTAPASSTPAAAPPASSPAAKSNGDVQQVSHETTVEDVAKASDLLSRTIAALEKEVQDAPQSASAAKAQLQLRMLYLAAGRRNDALRALPGLPANEQDFWSDEVFGLATYLDSDRTSDTGRRATEATLHLSKAASRLAELGSLSVRNMAFCTEVNSFGTYTAFAQNEFKPGQHVLLYVEVENFKSEESPKGFHTAMRSSYQIFDAQGRRVADQELPLTEEHCQNRRRDYFIRYFLTVPARAYDGKHTLQLTIEDTLGRKIGQSSIDFTVKEK
jgi:hypothetical protein